MGAVASMVAVLTVAVREGEVTMVVDQREVVASVAARLAAAAIPAGKYSVSIVPDTRPRRRRRRRLTKKAPIHDTGH